MDPDSLIHRYLLGEITEAETQQLDRLLAEDSELRRQFVLAATTDAGLREVALERAAESLQTRGQNPSRTKSRLLRPVVWASLAAAVLLAITIGRLPFQSTPIPTPTTHDDAFLATLADVGDDVVWSEDHALPRSSGEGLGKGWIRLDAGTIEVAFRSGATVRLEGPAMFGIDSCLRGTLEWGSIDVYAPESARSFTVNTPAMDVVDLGTRFSMRVDEDSGQADVSVSEGQVDLHLGNAGRNTGIYSLTEGQSARVDTTGVILKMSGRTIESDSEPIGLLARWSFNSIDGQVADGDLIEDSSPNALHGRVLQCPDRAKNGIQTVPGVEGNALDLSKHGAVELSEHLDALGELSSLTITAWVRNPKNMIVSISDRKDRNRVQFERSGNHLYYGWQIDRHWDAVRATVDGGWERDRWYHVAVTVDDRNVTLYRDGRVLIGPRSTGVLLGTPVQRPVDLTEKSCALIGKADRSQSKQVRNRGWRNFQYLDGQIDDVQIYNHALDEDAIRYLSENPGAVFSAADNLP